MTVYDIAVGVFLALLVRDIVALFAVQVARYLDEKKYEKEFEELMDNLEEGFARVRNSKKKKAAKKKS